MSQRTHHAWHSLALIAGLGLWTLAPYGGCSCENPMSGSKPAQATQLYGGLEAGNTPANLVDDFNDGANSTSATGHWKNVYVKGVLTQVWYNGNDPVYRYNLWGGGTYTQADAFGSSYFGKLAVPGTANIAGDPSSGQSACLQFGCPTCEYGRTSPPDSCTSPADCGQIYPFIEHGLYLSPQGANGEANVEFNAGGASVNGLDNATLGAHGLQFWVNTAGGTQYNTLTVKLILLYLSSYSNSAPCNTDAYTYHQATATIGAGGIVTIPFSSFKMGAHGSYKDANNNPIGTNLVWGTTNGGTLIASTGGVDTCLVDGNGNPTGTLQIMAIQFDPSTTTGSGSCSTTANNFQQEAYEFQIDNVEFY